MSVQSFIKERKNVCKAQSLNKRLRLWRDVIALSRYQKLTYQGGKWRLNNISIFHEVNIYVILDVMQFAYYLARKDVNN